MEKIIKVKGMHCNACRELIKMEAEDLGLLDKLGEIKIDEQTEQGEVVINMSDDEQVKFEQAIEAMDQYTILKD